MSEATTKLVNELSSIIDRDKFLLLSGVSAVGKTYISHAIVERCKRGDLCHQGQLPSGRNEYEVETELVSIHSSLTYDDFVYGIITETFENQLSFSFKGKLFIDFVNRANQSWNNHESKKYFLIIDDIGRGDIASIFGDAISLIEPHASADYKVSLHGYNDLWMSPNIYIIATYCTTIQAVQEPGYGFLRHFYQRHIESDFHYVNDMASEVFSDFSVTANAMFYTVRRLINDTLRPGGLASSSGVSKYGLGHGVFNSSNISLTMKCIVLPLLQQYIKDGVIDRIASERIEKVKKLISSIYTKDPASSNQQMITGYRKDITPLVYYAEDTTHKPIINLIARIKTQSLLSDDEIITSIMFHPGILVRISGKVDNVPRTYASPGYLFVKKQDRDEYYYGTTRTKDGRPKSPRYLYSSSDSICLSGTEYCVASEMQPKEYRRWGEDLNSDTFINERGSCSPNSIIFRILRTYYKVLDANYTGYLQLFPEDENIRLLKNYINHEFDEFIEYVKGIGSGSDEADVNLERNRMFREGVSKLDFLWKNREDIITWNGQTITIEGVYKMAEQNTYEEYAKAMDELDIHQMILQGPPGTSKTYSARGLLKHIGRSGEVDLSEDELNCLQINDYARWQKAENQSIAWDIVQFHPSYGYEDFVRGIEVSTVEDPDHRGSGIVYKTVDKVLGEMAKLASNPANADVRFYLIIDEINRANLATVFGELIYGLEYRGYQVATPYTVDDSNKVKLPDNLYIIGTMNTADKSIGGIDYAIRRRFLFFSLLPDRDIIVNYNLNSANGDQEQQKAINLEAVALFDNISKLFNADILNSEYYRDDVQIGHTYFLVDSNEQLYLRFRYQILPILHEYYKDGIFQFDQPGDNMDAFSELIRCINGTINLNSENDRVHEAFNNLVRA